MILGYFVLTYCWGVVKIRDASIESRLKESWEDNKIHLKQSLAVFIVGILVMIFAGVCEEFISVPIGNFVASL